MTRAIDLVATVAAVGIFGYFVYQVILPKLGDLQLPTFQFLQPPQRQQPPPVAPPAAAPQQPAPPVQQPKTPPKQPEAPKVAPAVTMPDKVPLPTAILPDPEKPKSKVEKPVPTKSTKTEQPKQQPPPPPGAIGKGLTPEALAMKSTGQKVAMNVARLDENSQRYNVNHKFQNYLMLGLFKMSPSSTLIEMKTDGPNHSGCSEIPKCFWAEPRFDTNGKSSLSMEMPHTPRKDYTISCPSCKSIPGSYAGKWIGYAVAAYGPQGGRIVEQWVDPTGTGNSWQLTLREKIDARWHGAANRPLPIEGKGLEAEIRMIDATSGQDMKNCFVYEIVPPTAASNLATTRRLMIDEPYLYNGFYHGRRL